MNYENERADFIPFFCQTSNDNDEPGKKSHYNI